jgi:formiminoglutamase
MDPVDRRAAVPHLAPPSVVRRAGWQDPAELRVPNWLTPWDGAEGMDAGLLGVPYGRASIGASGAGGAPEAIRLAFRGFTTYSVDWGVDLRSLRVRDLGDVAGHLTEVGVAHGNIEAAVAGVAARAPRLVPLLVGGDHSITAPAVRGFVAGRPGVRLGLVNIDAHLDVRQLGEGPHNGTPFRQILEGGQVAGQNLVELGIHGFSAAPEYLRWVRAQGATVLTGREVERRGISDCIAAALAAAGDGADAVYVSVDIDCLALPWGVGASAATAEGLTAWQLLEAVHACGRDPKVAALDLVEVDPGRDVGGVTVRTACSVLLTFLAGLAARASGPSATGG